MANKKMLLAENKPPQTSKGGGAGFCVYIGPTILGIIQNGTIYQGNKKQALNSRELAPVVQQYPLAAALVVNGEQLAASRQMVKQPGNLLNLKYQQLQKQAAKGE